MKLESKRALLASSTAILSAVAAMGFTAAVSAQDLIGAPTSAADGERGDTIVVTGSRIRRSAADTPAPVSTIGSEEFNDRGYVSAAEALNQIPSFSPQLNQAPGSGESAGSGQQFPDLFGIGPGRTLTLVNGRRFVASSNGLNEPQVDANAIPTGLIDRVEILQAGGAAVYGSDAIAGVVNYILKDDFEGFEIDAQTGITDKGDYWQSRIRGTFGFNFDQGRGNIAGNVEWSTTPALLYSDRESYRRLIGRMTAPNPADTGPNDGIPNSIELWDRTFYPFNANGVIWGSAAPPPCAAGPGAQPPPIAPCLTRLSGSPLQFAPDGQSVIPFNPGSIVTIPFASGGDGTPYDELVGFRTGVDRLAANVLGRYDLTDNIRLKTELLYSRTVGDEFAQGFPRSVLTPVGSGNEAIAFTIDNPFLTPAVIADLVAARPAFGTGSPLFLSKNFYGDLFPDNSRQNVTETYRGLLGVEGDFDFGGQEVYWTLSGSYARVKGTVSALGVHADRFSKAINAVSDGMGGAVCAVNADADPTNNDPSCVAFNPFGRGNSSQAARDYVIVPVGQDYVNEQIDILATIGTTLFTLPTGDVQAVLTYEHRDEQASFTPFIANQLGLIGAGEPQLPESGGYNTDEVGGEILLPIIGDNFTLPFAELVELSGSYRYVHNSLAGKEGVWAGNVRWVVSEDLTLRATRSRNFRAPTLTQVLSPTEVNLNNIGGQDPCDFRYIDSGPNPAVRRANCEAEWALNPGYEPLATFQNPSTNFTTAMITSGGNPDLQNEVSDTWTYGFVLQPRFIPGLTVSVDRVQIDLENALVGFNTSNFAWVCYDTSPQPAEYCDAFERMPTTDGTYPGGSIISGRTTTVNAGSVVFRGEVYYVGYEAPLEAIFGGGDPGRLSLSVQATHTAKKTTSVTGFDFSRTDNTVQDPDWVGRFDARYARGPMRLTYQLYYLDKVKASENATIENSIVPVISANITHSISGQYDLTDYLTVRAGVTNLTDKFPSYPTFTHGDAIGRRFFLGVNARF